MQNSEGTDENGAVAEDPQFLHPLRGKVRMGVKVTRVHGSR